ncbi:MAG: hypothetical protein LBL24_07490 [Bacteroidales bacterium]|nr:hypothetical protein [Bacteroidales bacterium]
MKRTAADIFKRYPKEDRVFITGDGQAFFSEADAGNHARRNRTGKELTVSKFLRVDSTPAVKDLAAAIASAATTEEVEEVLIEEEAYGNRKGVLEAARKKMDELTKTGAE